MPWLATRDSSTVATIKTYEDPTGLWPAGLTWRPCADTDVVGSAWNGTAWVPPAPVVVVPTSVGRWQLRVALAAIPSKAGGSGSALDDADALAAKQSQPVREAWAGAPTVERSSPTLAALAPGISFGDADMDAAFVAAASVSL